MNQDLNEITDEYDREFISLMLAIERRSESLNKYDKLRIKNWCKKLCQVTNNLEWKKNRNLHAICILDAVLNENFEEPYNKFPPEGSVPILNKTLVKSRLTKKFYQETMNIQQEQEGFEIKESNNEYLEAQDSIPEENAKALSKAVINKQNAANESGNLVIINNLRTELQQKNKEIQALKEEKLKMQQKIVELEKVLSSFMEMENNNNSN